jgi:hypothetical protein
MKVYTQAECEAVALENAGRLGQIGWGRETIHDWKANITLPQGWDVLTFGTGGMGNHATFVLKGTIPRNRALLREGTVRKWVREGLTRPEAEMLFTVQAQYKHELIAVICEVLNDQGATAAMAAHPGAYGAGSGRSQWRAAWEDVIPASVTKLSAPREAALAVIIKELQHA